MEEFKTTGTLRLRNQQQQLLRFYSLAFEPEDEDYHEDLAARNILDIHHFPTTATIPTETNSNQIIAASSEQRLNIPTTSSDSADNIEISSDSIKEQFPDAVEPVKDADFDSLNIFRPPRREIDREAESQSRERNATWLELFYDIFFVSILRILSKSPHTGFQDLFYVFARFSTIWWCWLMITLYDTRYDTDDLYHRTVKLIQMFCLAGFAISIEYCIVDLVLMNVFTASFIILRLTLLVNYLFVYFFAFRPEKRRNFYDPFIFNRTSTSNTKKNAKQSLIFMILSNVVSILLFGLSLITFVPWIRCIVWLCSFVIDVLIQLWIARRTKHVPFKGSHLPERMGLFTIIVLGECVVAFLGASAVWVANFNAGINPAATYLNYTSNAPLLETLLLSSSFIVICYCIWWMYFDDFCNIVMQHHLSTNPSFLYDRVRNLWIYLHLPVHMLITFMSILMVDTINSVDSFRMATFNASSVISSSIEGQSLAANIDGNHNNSTISFLNDSSITISDGALAQKLLSTFGLIFLLQSGIKVLNTYQNKAANYDYIACFARILFAIILFCMLAIPPTTFDSDTSLTIEPLVYLSIGLAILCILEVVSDLLVQYLNVRSLKITLTVSLTASNNNNIAPKLPSNKSANLVISDPIGAIPLRELNNHYNHNNTFSL